MQLLRVDSSARRGAVSRQLTDRFIARWREARPETTIVERNLATTELPHITDDWSATFGDPSAMTAPQRSYLSTSDALINEILGSDLILIGAPMYNFTISWPLKAWIDQVVRLNRTVAFGSSGPQGLLRDTRVVVLTARGSSYGAGPGDFQEPYLRYVLQFMGLSDVEFIHAEYQYRRERGQPALVAALEQIDQLVTRLTQENENAAPHTN